jgi:hypothetical protein
MTARMTEDQLHKAAHKMQQQGGSFAAANAEAYFVADSTNRMRLLYVFSDLFERFKDE